MDTPLNLMSVAFLSDIKIFHAYEMGFLADGFSYACPIFCLLGALELITGCLERGGRITVGPVTLTLRFNFG